MAKILFRLNGVPDDETNDVRELLTNNAIDFYETSSGNWGVSMPAIWLSDDDQFEKAKALLDAYQYKVSTICLIQSSKNEVQFTQKANRFIARPKRRMIVKYITSHKH